MDGGDEEVEADGVFVKEKPEVCLDERGRFARRERGVWRGSGGGIEGFSFAHMGA